MISIFNVCTKIENYLKEFSIKDNFQFRIFLRTNEHLYVYILSAEDPNETQIELGIHNIYANTEVEFLREDDLADNQFYTDIFNQNKIINLNKGRRRFTSLLSEKKYNIQIKSPIITFYSYKGGMGRSTTLASFASHLAINEGKNVFIIDCDFEAPGFTNFFLKNPKEENQRQGFIEYFLDRETNLTDKNLLENYTWQVDNVFSDKGTIRIMPAGNLDSKEDTKDFLNRNIDHYIEGLSRIDFTNEEYILEKFKNILEDIQIAFSPDVIIIDSRTGFCDMLGISAFNLSNIVVGFFRNDAQSNPGLHFFLKNIISNKQIEPCLVNSILPESISLKRKMFRSFEDDIQNLIYEIEPESELTFDCFPVSRNQNLELLGSSSEVIEDFTEIIRNYEIKDYNELFGYLSERLKRLLENDSKITQIDHITLPITTIKNSFQLKPVGKPEIDKMSISQRNQHLADLKEFILNRTSQKISSTSLYAENMSIENEFENDQFFYRGCMNDIFNMDKPFILGSKGTGKSYIYNALRSKKIVDKLKSNANLKDNYSFIYTIDKKDRIFKTNRLRNKSEKSYYNRFWLVYTWQIIDKELKKIESSFIPSIDSFEIRDDETTALLFEQKINDDSYIIQIEKEFNLLDQHLIDQGDKLKEHLVILYDQLDEIVHPSIWNNWIPSLIDFWRNKRYNRIFGKVFIRRDLFNRLYGITNINDIDNHSIDIEWTQEEMFSYFFKLVFSQDVSSYFWDIMYIYNDYHYELIKKNRQKYNKLEQTSLDQHLLRPLAVTFFGKEVDTEGSNRMGESYDWFYKNLKNADETISLRPFIDLIKFSIDKWKEKRYSNEEGVKPILFQKYYTDREVRKNAVDRHFEDIVRNEIGNKPVEYLFEYIDNHKEYQSITLKKDRFYRLFEDVISEYKDRDEMNDITPRKLEELLVTNGIIKKENYGRGDEYKFPFLYKYRLGLRGK